MLPFATGAQGAHIESGAAFVACQADAGTSSTMAALGAVAGDLALVYAPNGNTPSLSGGVAMASIGGQFYSRVLDSGDLARTISAAGNSITVLIYRDCATAAHVAGETVTPGAVGTRTFAGFTRHAKHAGLVCGIFGGPGATASINKPAAFTNRAYFEASSGGGNGRNLTADRLYPVNPYYVSGTAFEWSCTSNGIVAIVELRSV